MISGVGKAQSLKQAAGVGLCLPAVHLGKLRLQLAGAHAVLVGKVLLFIQGVLFLHDVVQALVAHNDGIQHAEFIILEVVLLEHRHPLVGRDDHLAGGRLQIAGEDAQEGGLACAVRADDAIAVAGDELQVHVLKQRLPAEVQRDIVDCNHAFVRLLLYYFAGPPVRRAQIRAR